MKLGGRFMPSGMKNESALFYSCQDQHVV